MRDLDLVGLSEDEQYVLLRGDPDEQFRVPVDGRLLAVLGGNRPRPVPLGRPGRPGQVENSMDSALRPRDIQARIRAGESPEAVAAVAQVSLERIMGYAVPVLAEREHVCEQARRSGLRRKHASGPGRLLGHAVDEHLRSNGWDPGAASWDSWRREDGRWSVTVSASRNGEPATFLFDLPGRYAFAHDDAARRLVGDEPPLSVEPEPDEPRSALPRVGTEPDAPRVTAAAAGPAAVPAAGPAVSVDVAALDAEAAQRVREPKARVSALDRLRRQRAHADEPLPFDSGPVTPIRTGSTEQLASADRDEVDDSAAADDDVEAIARVMSDPARTGRSGRRPVAVGEAETGGDPPTRDAAGGGGERKRRSGRRAVPSWDEIMFGSKPQG